jgi:hypothetical protein
MPRSPPSTVAEALGDEALEEARPEVIHAEKLRAGRDRRCPRQRTGTPHAVPSLAFLVMSESDRRAEQYAKALLRDADFTRLLDDDLAAERRGDVDRGLTREEFLAQCKDLLEPPAE